MVRCRPDRCARWLRAVAPLAPLALLCAVVSPVAAQSGSAVTTVIARPDTTDALARALAAEDRNDLKAAASAYTFALQQTLTTSAPDGERIAIALLGLERAYAEQGQLDSILLPARRVLQLRPTDPMAHSVQLRTLVSMGRDQEAHEAFVGWRRVMPQETTPYREYARLLLQRGRAQAADSVLGEATLRLGTGGALSGETAQLHVALGRWVAAATAYRAALREEPWLESAAQYGLQRAPVGARDSIRLVLEAPPAKLEARRLLSQLELGWNDPRRAWAALRAVAVDDSTVAAWRAFGERAEQQEAWLVARDAWTAVLTHSKTREAVREAQQRAADAALRSGDPAGALTLIRRPVAGAREDSALRLLEVTALSALDRVQEAQALVQKAGPGVDVTTRTALVRPLVSAWLRAGDLTQARAAMEGTELLDDDEMVGWLALYSGDLLTARKRMVRAVTQRPEVVDALGLLARVRRDQSPGLGAAFLLLARRDSTTAVARLIALADSLDGGGTAAAPAAPALLALASRLSHGAPATELWERIVRQYPKSPEAPEALLGWARLLRDRGDAAGAIAKLEQLLIDYTGSALAPQARRDLERLKGQVPPALR